VSALQGLADYYKECKDWPAVIECCEQAFLLFPEAEEELAAIGRCQKRLLLLLADAAEAQGDMELARGYDEKAKKVPTRRTSEFPGFMACDRREAMQLLAVGRPEEAARTLLRASISFRTLSFRGINFTNLCFLRPVMAALKVLIDALIQTGYAEHISDAELTRADVEETEAILAGYWEGVLEETRRELREQQRAGRQGEAEAGGGGGAEAKKKSKAAKRKQQKRKAQQQKKAAEVAEAAAVAAVEGGAGVGVAAGQQEQGGQGQQAQQQEEEQEEEEDDGQSGDGKDGEQAVAAAAAAAMAVMGLGETKDQQEEEEEEEAECSVCLNAIEGSDAANPAGPPLVCGHRYHAFCLRFWVERCTLKCIEPTCPYCRSPLQEMERT
jgi:hypothetical protein